MTPLVIGAASAISIGLIAMGWAVSGERSSTPKRRPSVDLRSVDLQAGISSRAVSPLMRWLSIRARRFTPVGLVEGMDRRIKLAGFSDRLPLERALAIKAMLTVTGVFIGVYLFLFIGRPGLGLVFPVASYFLLDLILWGRARERQQLIERALPDTMDQLKISVEAGLGFEAALERVGRHQGPLAQELGRVVSEIQLGLSRRDALRSMVERTDVPELRRFVAAMIHAEGFGIPIAKVLRSQADDLRDKRRMRAQEKAQRIPVLIVFPLIVFIFPVIFVIILGPAAINIYENLFGRL